MDEQIYTIPVTEAFKADTECPICKLYRELEEKAIDFTMGPSYMEDDVRKETNKSGFCAHHVKIMYGRQNRLGLALMLHTHTKRVIADVEKLSKKGHAAGGLFKKSEKSPVAEYLETLHNDCYICRRIDSTFERYVDTIFYLYRRESDFRALFAGSKGFCNDHYALLYEASTKYFSGKELDEFTNLIDKLYLENLKRVADDLEWYTNKFDYRYADAPWKNSKDALIRTVLKLDSTEVK